jgi:hypothetical protein
VLTGVEIAQAGNALPRQLALTMEHRGNGSSAVLCCDDEENVVLACFEILKAASAGRISQIGDLSLTLSSEATGPPLDASPAEQPSNEPTPPQCIRRMGSRRR